MLRVPRLGLALILDLVQTLKGLMDTVQARKNIRVQIHRNSHGIHRSGFHEIEALALDRVSVAAGAFLAQGQVDGGRTAAKEGQ